MGKKKNCTKDLKQKRKGNARKNRERHSTTMKTCKGKIKYERKTKKKNKDSIWTVSLPLGGGQREIKPLPAKKQNLKGAWEVKTYQSPRKKKG